MTETAEQAPTPLPWHEQRGALVVLTEHLVSTGCSAESVADAVARPWRWEDQYALAAAIHEHEQAEPTHMCRPEGLDRERYYCDAPDADCAWQWPPSTETGSS